MRTVLKVSVLSFFLAINTFASESFLYNSPITPPLSNQLQEQEDWLTRYPPDEPAGVSRHGVTVPLHSGDTLMVPWTSQLFSPTINGSIGLNEWVFAETLDISNIADTVDTVPPGSVLLYAVHDSFHLYIGVINYGDSTFSSFNDHLMFFIDTDHDGGWDTLTEGWWRFWTAGGLVDSNIWDPGPTGINYQLANNVDFAISTSGGPLQWEVRWNLITSPLSANLEDTLGLAVRVHADAIFPYSYGRWPLNSILGFPGDPTTFGDFILVLENVGVEEENSAFSIQHSALRLLQNQPNPFHTSTLIQYQIPSANHQSPITSHVTLRIYDITGRLVETLVDEPQEPGIYQLPITRHQLPGSGIYFYRIQIGDFVSTMKMTLLR